MDDTLYLRGKRQERGDYKAKFMTDGFDRWAETSAPARVGQVEKEPSDEVNTTMSGNALYNHMCKNHMKGGVYGYSGNPYIQPEMDMGYMDMPYYYDDVEGDGLFSALGKAAKGIGRVGSKVARTAAKAAKAAVKTVKYASKVGKKYVKKAKDFYKKNKKEIDATVKGIKDVADATGLTGLALRKATEFAKEKGLIPEPPEEVEEAAEEIADDEIEEEIEGGTRERSEGHFTGGSREQIMEAMGDMLSRGGATTLYPIGYEMYGVPKMPYGVGGIVPMDMYGNPTKKPYGKPTKIPYGAGGAAKKKPLPSAPPAAPKPKIDRVEALRAAKEAYEAAAKAARAAPVAGGRKPSGRAPSARAAIVKQVMAERGVSLPQASRIVKEEGLY